MVYSALLLGPHKLGDSPVRSVSGENNLRMELMASSTGKIETQTSGIL